MKKGLNTLIAAGLALVSSNAEANPIDSMVNARMADHQGLVKALLADDNPAILCEKNQTIVAASRYSDVPQNVAQFCKQIAITPDHPKGNRVCNFNLNSPDLKSVVTSMIMNGSTGGVESARSGYVDNKGLAGADLSKDPRCKLTVVSPNLPPIYQGAGCGTSAVSAYAPISQEDLVVLRSSFCK